MKKWFTLVVAVAVAGFIGCSGGSDKKTEVKTKEGSFTLKAPSDVTLTQGESKDITVSIDRKDYTDAVTFDVEGLPEGVTVDGDKKIEKGKDEAKLTIKAGDKAKEMKDHVVDVKSSAAGSAGTVKFKVTVKKK